MKSLARSSVTPLVQEYGPPDAYELGRLGTSKARRLSRSFSMIPRSFFLSESLLLVALALGSVHVLAGVVSI